MGAVKAQTEPLNDDQAQDGGVVPLEIVCYPVGAQAVDIQPGRPTRTWMDETSERYAYRCLPLSIANGHGWEVRCPETFAARWNGGNAKEDIELACASGRDHVPAVSHFGFGVLTFHVNGIIRTPPGFDLFVTGPINEPKDGIYGLTGVIETDWSPYSFTMNWKFTRPNHTIRFEKGEPFCHFFPVPRGLIEACAPRYAPFEENAETKRLNDIWSQSRSKFIKDLDANDPEAKKQKWQRTYFHGRNPDGSIPDVEHRTKLRAPGFKKP
ncbi:MAG: DUF6065 family protein [Geminicoccaceae bacterium]